MKLSDVTNIDEVVVACRTIMDRTFFAVLIHKNIFIIAIDDAFGLIKLLWSLIYSNSWNNGERRTARVLQNRRI